MPKYWGIREDAEVDVFCPSITVDDRVYTREVDKLEYHDAIITTAFHRCVFRFVDFRTFKKVQSVLFTDCTFIGCTMGNELLCNDSVDFIDCVVM